MVVIYSSFALDVTAGVVSWYYETHPTADGQRKAAGSSPGSVDSQAD